MTIQNVSSTNTNNFSVIQKNTVTALSNNIKKENEYLSPEQKNTLQKSFEDKIAEQTNNIKSNFQTAKDIDLTRAYYQQQQKIVDIYMQTSTENDSNSNSNISATKALTESYASLYQLHQTIKEGAQQLPSYADKVQPPSGNPEIQPLMNRQTDAYNSFMMPTTNSYLSLQA